MYLINSNLPVVNVGGEEVRPHVFTRDGQIFCSAESNSHCPMAALFADYYGEFRNHCSWISDDLTKWAKETFGEDVDWDWENPGLLSLSGYRTLDFTLNLAGTDNDIQTMYDAIEAVSGVNCQDFLVKESYLTAELEFSGVPTKEVAYLIIDAVYGPLGPTNPRADNAEILELSTGE